MKLFNDKPTTRNVEIKNICFGPVFSIVSIGHVETPGAGRGAAHGLTPAHAATRRIPNISAQTAPPPSGAEQLINYEACNDKPTTRILEITSACCLSVFRLFRAGPSTRQAQDAAQLKARRPK